ncbi:MAG: HlyD family efflux transporter periplasmic adaptor subunit [Clostridia bacterium]|nr:HlyD family efflux transporter periplasmic adaptor subunit [Clostridia bacterium]
MEPVPVNKGKKVFKKGVPRFVIIGIICVVVLGGLALTYALKGNPFAKEAAVQQRTARVVKGNLNISISGSGPIASSNRVEVASGVQGTITKANFKEGDKVKAGDLLFELDDSDAKSNIEKIKSDIAQMQVTVDDNKKSLSNLTIKAPFGGQVTEVVPKAGDVLQKNATILTITDSSKLKAVVQFSGSLINKISTGQKAVINIQDLMQSVNGTVTFVGNKPYTAPGGEVFDVEITFANPGSLKEGLNASAEITTSKETLTSANAGKIEYINYQTIKSDAGGTVKSVKVRKNNFVKAGEVLVELQNDELVTSGNTVDLKIKDLYAQLESAEKKLSDYKIYAPIDGVIISQSKKAGDIVKAGDALMTISDIGHMQFEVSIDELDIAKVKIGQKVNVTVDALTETSAKPLTGEVIKIAIEGTSSNGVTTYPVTIRVNDTSNLKIGMNANAEIMINEKSGVLLVPLEAVQKMRNRSFVMVKGTAENSENSSNFNGGNGGNRGSVQEGNGNTNSSNRAAGNMPAGMARGNSANAQYYANSVRKPVEVGINNSEYIEIISGLQEGDEVILPPLATSTQQNTTQMRTGIGGIGGFGGGMGGMTGGRNNSQQGGNSPQGGNTQQGGSSQQGGNTQSRQ